MSTEDSKNELDEKGDPYAEGDLDGELYEKLNPSEPVGEDDIEPEIDSGTLTVSESQDEITSSAPLYALDAATYTLHFGPSGGFGWLRVYKNGQLLKAMKAANITTNPNGNRNVRGEAPCPPGTYDLNPSQNFSSGRKGIYVKTPGTGRSEIFIHTTIAGTPFAWYPTEGCIRVQPASLEWLKDTLVGHTCTLRVYDTHWDGAGQWSVAAYSQYVRDGAE